MTYLIFMILLWISGEYLFERLWMNFRWILVFVFVLLRTWFKVKSSEFKFLKNLLFKLFRGYKFMVEYYNIPTFKKCAVTFTQPTTRGISLFFQRYFICPIMISSKEATKKQINKYTNINTKNIAHNLRVVQIKIRAITNAPLFMYN